MTAGWRIPILTYHALHAPGWDYGSNDHVALETDLGWLARNDFRVVTLEALVRHCFQRPLARLGEGRIVALSFDDGTDHDYFDFSHSGYGHLKSFRTLLSAHPGLGWDGGPPAATSFVIVSPAARAELDRACIAGRGQWRDCWWVEAASGDVLDIGNHSWDHTHPAVTDLAVDERHRGRFDTIDDFESADSEILQAERYIREKTGQRSVPLFAYPYGESNDFLRLEYFPARAAWFSAAFTTAGEPVTAVSGRWAMPRYVCGEHWRSPEEFETILADARV